MNATFRWYIKGESFVVVRNVLVQNMLYENGDIE